MRKWLLILGILISVLGHGQIAISTLNTNYTENFDGLASTGTSDVLPNGWLINETGTNANTTYAADNGVSNSGNTYSYGATGTTERALGSILSGSLTPSFGAQFLNQTGSIITSLSITYTAEIWRAGLANRGVLDSLFFSYSTNATTLADGVWNSVVFLDASSPNSFLPTAGALDGNLPINRQTITYTITGLSIAPGTRFFIRWIDYNIASSDDGLAIDNFSISANGEAAPPCIAPTTAPTLNNISAGGNSLAGSLVPVADADSYLVAYSTANPFNFTPVDGVTYTPGQTIGDATISSFSVSNLFFIGNLSPNTTYQIKVYSARSINCAGGPLYFATPLSIQQTTAAVDNGIPAGYYNSAEGLVCKPLKLALGTRTGTDMLGLALVPKTYGELWTQYLVSDVKPREVGTGSATVIYDMYSDNPFGPDPYNFTPGPVANGGQQDNGTNVNGEGELYNREHSVPLSWFGGSTSIPGPATDYMHIFPTDKWVNSLRSNYLYGEVADGAGVTTSQNGGKLGPSAIAGFTGPVFEPIDTYKGDFARAFFYFVTRYIGFDGGTAGTEALDGNDYPSIDIPYMNLMLSWHNADPVSDKELARNNAAYLYQGNRNPYIDHPEYAPLIWDLNCPDIRPLPISFITLRGALQGNNIMLKWQVATEQLAAQYIVERSYNGTTFTKIGTVYPAQLTTYQFLDDVSHLTNRRIYYRVKLQTTDGKEMYSAVFSLHIGNQARFQLFPNPASQWVEVQFGNASFSGQLRLLDNNGRLVMAKQMQHVTQKISLDVSKYAPGLYYLQLQRQGEKSWQAGAALIIQH